MVTLVSRRLSAVRFRDRRGLELGVGSEYRDGSFVLPVCELLSQSREKGQ
jgi:hypothetical protein